MSKDDKEQAFVTECLKCGNNTFHVSEFQRLDDYGVLKGAYTEARCIYCHEVYSIANGRIVVVGPPKPE